MRAGNSDSVRARLLLVRMCGLVGSTCREYAAALRRFEGTQWRRALGGVVVGWWHMSRDGHSHCARARLLLVRMCGLVGSTCRECAAALGRFEGTQ